MTEAEWKLALLKKLNLDPARPEHQAVAEACLVYCEAGDEIEDNVTLIEKIVDPEYGDGEIEEEE